jgi:hypothetical protein
MDFRILGPLEVTCDGAQWSDLVMLRRRLP